MHVPTNLKIFNDKYYLFKFTTFYPLAKLLIIFKKFFAHTRLQNSYQNQEFHTKTFRLNRYPLKKLF